MIYLTYQQTPLELLDSIDYSISYYTSLIDNSYKYGDPCPDSYKEAVSSLVLLRDGLKREARRNAESVECTILEEESYRPYLVKNIPEATVVDTSGEDGWILANPQCACINKEKWEQCSFNYCNSIGITFTVSKHAEEVCNLAFEITRDIIDPCIGIALAITTKATSLGYANLRSGEECNIDYNIAIEKGCDLDYDVFRSAYQSGLTYDLIKLIYDNNLEVIYEDGAVYLKSPLTKYKLSSFFFNNALGDDDFKELVNCDPREFVRKYLSDYNLKETDIVKILQ